MKVPIPPAGLREGLGPFDDESVFIRSGRETVELARRLIGLAPQHRVLDVGCGCGRVALPLMEFLGPEGTYAGFDVSLACIEWCRRNIEAVDSRFQFRHLDVQSESYNPRGSVAPDVVTFPYAGHSVDLAILSSVFTHMMEAGVTHYLSELGRVLRPNGKALISLLLMNGRTDVAIQSGATSFAFVHRMGEHTWTLNPAASLEGVSISEDWFCDAAKENAFDVEQIDYGNWREKHGWYVEHDWVVLHRVPSAA